MVEFFNKHNAIIEIEIGEDNNSFRIKQENMICSSNLSSSSSSQMNKNTKKRGRPKAYDSVLPVDLIR
jgi:hypothetical protein